MSRTTEWREAAHGWITAKYRSSQPMALPRAERADRSLSRPEKAGPTAWGAALEGANSLSLVLKEKPR